MTHLSHPARLAAQALAAMTTSEKNAALVAISAALDAARSDIFAANAEDIRLGRAAGLRESLLDRLLLDDARLDAMRNGIAQVIALPDPVGEILDEFTPASGIQIQKVRTPMGVIGMIYEARPNVTVDAAVLCLKAGSAVILRGGKEAIHSNTALVAAMQSALPACPAAVQLVTDTSRQSATTMMHATGTLDLLIPRGGAGLIQTVVRESTVPVIETGAGICHTFVDASADLVMAATIAANAKCSRPSVCNAMETLLIHASVAAEFLPLAFAAMMPHKVEFRGCPATCALLPQAIPATPDNYHTEHGDFILNVKILPDLDSAIDWINTHGTKHSECIITENPENAARFRNQVDAAAVYHNVSTRFTDGFEFGLGAEIGISTQKTHPRGPMGLREICTYQYRISGTGQTR
jgi:gamma-glutamyl phosphate reductase